jgi:prepilin-type N-terminal cleavage/methylation domain-containing protein
VRLGVWGARDDRVSRDEGGFTLIELTVAMSLLAIVMLGFAGAVFGTMNAWSAARQRSAFVEIANAEMETLRALPYQVVGVNKTNEPGWASAYDAGGQRDGRDHVDVTAVDTTNRAPKSVTTVTESPVKGVILPYTVRRWVTWTDVNGGAGHVFKRLEIRIDWNESNDAMRSLTLTSVHYPGGQGASAANDPPTATFTVSPSSGATAGSAVSFDASGTTDPESDAVTYEWNFGDGTVLSTASVPTITHTYVASGSYTVLLTATDVRGEAGSTSQTINVGASDNTAPTASFTLTPVLGTAPMTVNVDANASSDPNGDTLNYSWNWGDSTAAGSGVNSSHIFQSAGTFTITLTVSDPSGATSTSVNQVVVLPLNCDIKTGYFKNPSTNGSVNDVDVGSNGKPVNNGFTFYATSNTACTSITARITDATGIWAVPLTPISTVNGTVTWQATDTFANRDKFNTGNLQTGEFWSPGSTGATDRYSFTFNVHT